MSDVNVGLTKLLSQTLPREWRLSPRAMYTQLSYPTCGMSRIPTLRDGQGRLKTLTKFVSVAEEFYSLPTDFVLDNLDKDAEKRKINAAKKEQAAAIAREKERVAAELAADNALRAKELNEQQQSQPVSPTKSTRSAKPAADDDDDDESEEDDSEEDDESEEESEEDDEDDEDGSEEGSEEDESEEDDPVDDPPTGTPCVSVRMPSNGVAAIGARAFEGVPHLRSLDLTTNHLTGNAALLALLATLPHLPTGTALLALLATLPHLPTDAALLALFDPPSPQSD